MEATAAKPLDNGTRLAVERTRLAYERTLMAWIRTGTSLITFGFTIYKFFQFESGRGAVPPVDSHVVTPRQFGMIMIGTGLIALTLATIDHHRSLKRMQRDFGTAGRSVSMAVAFIVSAVGLLALVAALFRA